MQFIVATVLLISISLFGQEQTRTLHVYSPWKKSIPLLTFLDSSTGTLIQDREECGWYTYTDTTSGTFPLFLIKTKAGEQYGTDGEGSDTYLDINTQFPSGDNSALYLTFTNSYYEATKTRPDIPDAECLIGLLKATLFDWTADDFMRSSDSTPAFEPNGGICETDSDYISRGLVKNRLDSNGLPEPSDQASRCMAEKVTDWFQERTVNFKSNQHCLDLNLTPNERGNFALEYVRENPKEWVNPKGFFPLDTFDHPNNSLLYGTEDHHNYHFCMMVNSEFTYLTGQEFEFEGDDDLWVFVDSTLVLDLGGIHQPVRGVLRLDSVLTPQDINKTHTFDIFYCERKTTLSNLKIETDIDFKVPDQYHHEIANTKQGTTAYTIYSGRSFKGGCNPYANVVDSTSLFYWSSDTLLDTTTDSLLAPGTTHFEGIAIDRNSFEFSITPENISSLPLGTYYLIHTSTTTGSDTHYVEVKVTTNEYYITFVDPNNSDRQFTDAKPMAPIFLGTDQSTSFAVRVFEIFNEGNGYDTVPCIDCEGTFFITASDTALTVTDSLVSKELLTFGITAAVPVTLGQLSITYTPDVNAPLPAKKEPRETESAEITFSANPNFYPAPSGHGYIDQDSDGTMDRIVIRFDNIPPDDAIESLKISFKWPHSKETPLIPEPGNFHRADDSLFAYWDIPTDQYTIRPYTTSIVDKVFEEATVTYQYPWMEEPEEYTITLSDMMPPVIVQAWLYQGDLKDTLVVTLSEEVQLRSTYKNGTRNYELKPKKEDEYESLRADKSSLYHTDNKWMVQTLFFDVSGSPEDHPIWQGDYLKITEGADRIRDPYDNLPGDSTLAVVVKAIVNNKTTKNDFIYIESDYLDESFDSFESQVFIPNGQSIIDSLKAGIMKPAHMKDILWHLMDDDGKKEDNASRFSFVYSLSIYSTLGTFVNNISSKVSCDDTQLFGNSCLEFSAADSPSFALYIPPFSNDQRLLGTGVYIVRFEGYYRYDPKGDGPIITTTPEHDFFNIGVLRKE
ncbi:MAG: fibro-slime domain-containing protein [Fibrobacterales bacterium]